MKRVLSDVAGESEPDEISALKIAKIEPKAEIKEELIEYDGFVQLGSESIPSPISSSSSPVENSTPLRLPKYMELKCGALVGRLHTERFICPGIREKCIDVPDRPGELMTPVEFTVIAEKSKQKDWKGAIKHNGRMLRTLMEYKQLDFYNHHEMCSFKCHSRNYITKNGGTAPKNAPRVATNPHRRHSSASTASQAINQLFQGELIRNPNFLAAFAAHCSAENQKRQEEADRKLYQKQQAIKCLMDVDPVRFWSQAVHSNLSHIVLNRINSDLGVLAQNLASGRDIFTSAEKMAKVVQALGISDSMSREMCGEFVLPTPSINALPRQFPSSALQNRSQNLVAQEIEPSLPIQNSLSFRNNNNNNNNEILSSTEKLELMIKNAF